MPISHNLFTNICPRPIKDKSHALEPNKSTQADMTSSNCNDQITIKNDETENHPKTTSSIKAQNTPKHTRPYHNDQQCLFINNYQRVPLISSLFTQIGENLLPQTQPSAKYNCQTSSLRNIFLTSNRSIIHLTLFRHETNLPHHKTHWNMHL